MKKNKKSGSKAFFVQRLGAFMVDVLIITVLASIISTPFIDTKRNEKLQEDAMKIVEKMQNSEITMDEYITDYSSIYYKLARVSGIVSLVTLFLDVLYFVVYQFYFKGQTVGKKLMKIKVISDNGNLTMDQMIVRSMISNFILLNIISFIFMLFIPKNIYFYCVGVLEAVQYLIVFISIIMILKREDGCAIHDLVAHTKVVRV